MAKQDKLWRVYTLFFQNGKAYVGSTGDSRGVAARISGHKSTAREYLYKRRPDKKYAKIDRAIAKHGEDSFRSTTMSQVFFTKEEALIHEQLAMNLLRAAGIKLYNKLNADPEHTNHHRLCDEPNCPDTHYALGLCHFHYFRQWHNRSLIDARRKYKRRKARRTCSKEGCSRKHYARDLCARHYKDLWNKAHR